jgi:hypothetical protein
VNARPALRAIVLVVTAASACAHQQAVDKRARNANPQAHTRARDANAQVPARAQEARAWLNQFPLCEGPIDAKDVDSLPKEQNPDPPTVSVRGLMTLESAERCSLMECMGSACCNGCFIEWVLAAPRPTAGQERRQLAIREFGISGTMGIGAQDCTVEEVRRQFPSAEVIVSGRVRNEGSERFIIPDSICRVAPHQ